MLKKVILAIMVIATIVLIAMTLWYTKQIKELDDGNKGVVTPKLGSLEDVRLIGGLSGSIIMELVDKSADREQQPTYSLSLKDPLEPILKVAPPYVAHSSAGFNFANSDVAVFTSIDMYKNNTQDTADDTPVVQIYAANISSNDAIFPKSPGGQKQITDDGILFKQMPALSPDNLHVLYMATTSIPSSVVSSDSWSVYMANIEDDKPSGKKVTTGAYPKWIDNTHFAYLTNGGLSMYDLSTHKSTMLWGVEGSAVPSNSRLDVSDNGKYIAWSLPDAGKLTVIKINHIGSGNMKPNVSLYGQVDVHGFWPVFSPDSKYLAIQSVDWDKLSSDPKPELAIYNIGVDRLKKLKWSFDLSKFDQEKMFITDWTKL